MLNFIYLAISLIIAITIHEYSHAWSADRLGDPTPRMQGRLTLNPLAHLDPLGTLALIFIHFGWGKPVQFDPYNLANPKRDSALISLAGPASNLILAIILSLTLNFFTLPYLLISLFYTIISMNIVLAVFNLIPIYPLDGEKILSGLLPPQLASEYSSIMRQYGTMILIFMLLPIGGTSPVSALIYPIINTITNFLL